MNREHKNGCCHYCTERYPGRHDHCEKFIEESKAIEAEKKRIKDAKRADRIYMSTFIKNVEKSKKKVKR